MLYGALLTMMMTTSTPVQPVAASYVATPNARQGYPSVLRFVLTFDAAALGEQGPTTWHMTATTASERTFGVYATTHGVPLSPDMPPRLVFDDYVFQAQGEPALRYVHGISGAPLLPRYAFQEHFIPRAAVGSTVDEHGLTRAVEYLGHLFLLTKVEPLSSMPSMPEAKRIALDPGLLLGTGRNVREVEDGRIDGPEDYTYATFERHHYDEMREVGINYVVVDAEQRGWVLDEPFFYLPTRGMNAIQVPEEFYRSNFWGWVNFMDEPAILLFADRRVGDYIQDIRDVAVAMRTRARADYRRLPPTGDLTRWELPVNMPDGNLAPLRLYPTDVPYWETIISAAHYQLAVGGSGMVQESRYQLDAARWEWRQLIGDAIEPTTDELLLMDFAWLRGAARNFDKDWGIAIYGQADPAISPRAVTLAYDLGARYLWFWTSDHGHHLPYREQLELSRIITEHARAHPRPERETLLHAAKTAIAIPEGYVYEASQLWKFPGLEVDNPNHTGTPHRAVLRRALGEALLALRRGESVDFAVDDRDFDPQGYERVVRVGYDAKPDGPVRHAPATPRLDVAAMPSGPLVEPGTAPVVVAEYRDTPPTIDARLDDWADATWYPLTANEVSAQELSGPKDCSGRCAVAWDHETLYVAVEVTDDIHAQPHRGWLTWAGDGVQVGFDPLFARTPDGYAPADSEFGLALHDSGDLETFWWHLPQRTGVGDRDGMRVAARREGTTTTYEIAVPADALGWSPFLTDRCGIAISVNDLDEGTHDLDVLAADIEGRLNMRNKAIELVDALVYHKRPDLFAVLELASPPESKQPALACLLSRGDNTAQASEAVGMTLHTRAEHAVDVLVEITLRNEGGEVGHTQAALTLPQGSSAHRLDIANDSPAPGFYAVEARVVHEGEVIAQQEMEVLFW